jgi:hypothetical protein
VKTLIEDRILRFRLIERDSYGSVSLAKVLSNSLGELDMGGYNRILKEGEKYFSFHLYNRKLNTGLYDSTTGVDSSPWRRMDILMMSPAREAYASLQDSFDSCLEIEQFIPINFHMDSIYDYYDSSPIDSDGQLFKSFHGIMEQIVEDDSAPIFNGEVIEKRDYPGLSPTADSYVTYRDDNLLYNGGTYNMLREEKSYSMRESSGQLVVQIEDDYNVFSSFRDSIQGVDVIYYNTTQDQWEHRNFSDDSIVEGWQERTFFIDSGITVVSTSSDSDARDYDVHGSALPYYLRDRMNIYHFPDYEYREAIESLQGAGGTWQGTLDSLGSPWDTWSYPERGFQLYWIAGPFVANNVARDSYQPMPLGIFGLEPN